MNILLPDVIFGRKSETKYPSFTFDNQLLEDDEKQKFIPKYEQLVVGLQRISTKVKDLQALLQNFQDK